MVVSAAVAKTVTVFAATHPTAVFPRRQETKAFAALEEEDGNVLLI
jgi:hypothetical protein